MNKGVSVRKKNPLYMCAVRYGREKRGGVSTEYYGSGKRNGRSLVRSTTVVVLATPPPSSGIQRKHTRLPPPPKKELYFPRFSSSGVELGRVRFYSLLPYSGNSAASLVTTQAQQQKRLDSGEEKAEGETLFSRVTTTNVPSPASNVRLRREKSPFLRGWGMCLCSHGGE